MRRACLYLCLLIPLAFTACSSMSSGEGGESTKIDSLRGAAPFDRRTIRTTINRNVYREKLQAEGSVNDARLVQVFHRGEAETEQKEYRLLDVRPGSVYELLKIKQADVLVAANGYVVPTPSMFWNYLRLISRFEVASIEVRRGGTPVLLEYTFEGEIEIE